MALRRRGVEWGPLIHLVFRFLTAASLAAAAGLPGSYLPPDRAVPRFEAAPAERLALIRDKDAVSDEPYAPLVHALASEPGWDAFEALDAEARLRAAEEAGDRVASAMEPVVRAYLAAPPGDRDPEDLAYLRRVYAPYLADELRAELMAAEAGPAPSAPSSPAGAVDAAGAPPLRRPFPDKLSLDAYERGPWSARKAELPDSGEERFEAMHHRLFNKKYFKRIGRDARDMAMLPARWDGGDWLKVGAVLAATGVGLTVDPELREGVQGIAPRGSDFEKVLTKVELLGRGGFVYAGLGALYLEGHLFKHEGIARTAEDGLEGALLSGLVIHGLKMSIGRSRPNAGRGEVAFRPFSFKDASLPSGHTGLAFAAATAVSKNAQRPWVSVLSYGTAGLVGIERIYHDKHWASDVALGAVLGHVVTDWVIDRRRREPSRDDEHEPRRVHFVPGPGGGSLVWQF